MGISEAGRIAAGDDGFLRSDTSASARQRAGCRQETQNHFFLLETGVGAKLPRAAHEFTNRANED